MPRVYRGPAPTLAEHDATKGYVDAALAALQISGAPDATTSVKGVVELATTAEAVEGTDAVRAVSPAALAAALEARLAAFDGGSVEATGLQGPGIDPTGTSDSTVGVKAFFADLDSSVPNEVKVPSKAVILLNDTIEIPSNTTLLGPGELRWTAGIADRAALSIVGDNVEVQGVRITNPNEMGLSSGGRNYGIEIKASNVRILSNFIEKFQNGVAVRSGGEYHNVSIIGNRIKDVIGAGGGPNSTANIGEDRGDGIVIWGSQATVVGNVVNCKVGTDARIGIHAEYIGGTTNIQDSPHPRSMVTFGDNVVYGQFRRSLVIENVASSVVSGNVAADATWWGISVIINARDTIITNNTIIWTRTALDGQGANFSPIRSGIMVWGGVQRATIHNNNIYAASGSAASCYIATQSDVTHGSPAHLTVTNNKGFNDGGSVTDGFGQFGSGTEYTITDNQFHGYNNRGVGIQNAPGSRIEQNTLVGKGAGQTSFGISSVQTGNWSSASNNFIRGVTTGINFQNLSSPHVVGNRIQSATTGINLTAATAPVVTGNSFATVTTQFSGYTPPADGGGNVTTPTLTQVLSTTGNVTSMGSFVLADNATTPTWRASVGSLGVGATNGGGTTGTVISPTGLAHTNSSFTGTLSFPTYTAARTWNMPDASGTLALVSDIPTEGGGGGGAGTLQETLQNGNVTDLNIMVASDTGAPESWSEVSYNSVKVTALGGNAAELQIDRVQFTKNSYTGALTPPTTLTTNLAWSLPDTSGTLATKSEVDSKVNTLDVANTNVVGWVKGIILAHDAPMPAGLPDNTIVFRLPAA